MRSNKVWTRLNKCNVRYWQFQKHARCAELLFFGSMGNGGIQTLLMTIVYKLCNIIHGNFREFAND